MITRALGTEEAVEVDTHTDAMQTGDLYLICSDGLTIMVGDEEILDLLDGAPRISMPPLRRSSQPPTPPVVRTT